MNFEYIDTKSRFNIILTFRSIFTRVQIQFPTQWNEVKCARVRTQNMPASFTPDMEITGNDDNDDNDDNDNDDDSQVLSRHPGLLWNERHMLKHYWIILLLL